MSKPAGPPRHQRRRGDEDQPELWALVTRRGSQVTSLAALRSRDWARPSAADLAAAEQDLVVVRRHYVPPQPLETVTSRSVRPGAAGRQRRKPGP